MFGKKRWITAVLAAVLAMGFTCPAMAAINISSVSLRITSDIEVGSDYGDVEVTSNSSKYEVSDYEVTNRPNGEWKRGSKPKVKITLTTDPDSSYQFKSGFSKSNVSLSGVDATVTSVSRSNSRKLTVNVTLNSLTGSGDYDLSVYDVHWDEDQGQGYWEGGEDAKRYELKIYRGSSLQNSSTLTTSDSSYNFSGYITRSGTYSFKVRAVYNSSYKGEWMDSGEWYVDSETARDIKNSVYTYGTGTSGSSSGSSGGPGNNNNTGAWLKDNVGWWYCNADRSYTVNNWQYINNKWYYFNERGYMVTGWVLWKNLYYYCGPNGDMLTNTWTPDGYYVDGNGVWVQGQRR